MATRSVREHPGRFLVSILEGFMDKLLSEKTTGAMQACWWDQDCIYLIISQKEGPAPTPPCYLTLLNFLLSGLEINKVACSVSWDLVIMGYIFVTMGIEVMVPLKGRRQGCACFQKHLWMSTEAHKTQENLFKKLSAWVCFLP